MRFERCSRMVGEKQEAVIYLTNEKKICSDSGQFQFVAKIGGVLNLQDMSTAKVKELLPKLDSFGYYLVVANYRTTKGPNSYLIVCPNLKSQPFDEGFVPLNSFLPRINSETGHVITALRISGFSEKSKERQWTRFVGSNKSSPNGFHELCFKYNYDNDHKQKTKANFVGFYVNKNTSLIIYDIGTTDPRKAMNPDQNRTLVQEGGFVYADADLLFRLCDQTEDKLLSAKEIVDRFKGTERGFLGSDKYKKTHLIRDPKDPKKRSVYTILEVE